MEPHAINKLKKVVVEVEEFGLTEQKIMQLQTRRLGGTP